MPFPLKLLLIINKMDKKVKSKEVTLYSLISRIGGSTLQSLRPLLSKASAAYFILENQSIKERIPEQ